MNFTYDDVDRYVVGSICRVKQSWREFMTFDDAPVASASGTFSADFSLQFVVDLLTSQLNENNTQGTIWRKTFLICDTS